MDEQKKKILVWDYTSITWNDKRAEFDDLGATLTICSLPDPKQEALESYDLIVVKHSMEDLTITTDYMNPKWKKITAPAHPIPVVEINNYQNLDAAQGAWDALSQHFTLIKVLQAAARPADILAVLDSDCPQWLLDLPLPARLIDENNRTRTNNKWNWGDRIPDPALAYNDNHEFTAGLHSTDYVLKESMTQSEGRLQVAYHLIGVKGVSENPLEHEVEMFWNWAESLGFGSMRFYRVLKVAQNSDDPNENDVLELNAHFPLVSGEPNHQKFLDLIMEEMSGPPIAWVKNNRLNVQVDNIAQKHINEVLEKSRPQDGDDPRTKFKFLEVRKQTSADASPTSQLTAKYLKIKQRDTVYIPVRHTTEDRLVGMIVLDATDSKSDSKKFDRAVKQLSMQSTAPRSKIRRIQAEIEKKQENRAEHMRERADKFMQKHFKERSDAQPKNGSKAYIDELLTQIIELSGYDLASLAWRTFENQAPWVRHINLRASIYEQEPADKIKSQIAKPLTKSELPAMHLAFETKKPVYFHDKLDANSHLNDSNDLWPRMAIPIEFQGRYNGVLGLSVKAGNVRFLQRDVERLEKFLNLCASGIYFSETENTFAIFKSQLAHELKRYTSDIFTCFNSNPVSKDNPLTAIKWFTKDISALVGEMLNHEVKGTDLLETINEIIESAKQVAPAYYKKLDSFTDISSVSSSIDMYVLSFAVRNMLSNAFLHGEEADPDNILCVSIHLKVNNDRLIITVINPGTITDAEIAEAFVEGPGKSNYGGGSGIGLSIASAELAKCDASISIFRSTSFEDHIQVTLDIPLISEEADNE